MKLTSDPRPKLHVVKAVGASFVDVHNRRYTRSLLLLPDRIDAEWGPADFAALDVDHLAALAQLRCDVLLLGTGQRQRFPAPALLRPLIEAGIATEIMDTAAACRTFNILVAEGRKVAAALIVEAADS